jgi:hypothetical protein
MTDRIKRYATVKNVVAASALCMLCQGAMAQDGGPGGIPGDNGGSVSIPVPATIALFGIGVAGLVAARRNKKD